MLRFISSYRVRVSEFALQQGARSRRSHGVDRRVSATQLEGKGAAITLEELMKRSTLGVLEKLCKHECH